MNQLNNSLPFIPLVDLNAQLETIRNEVDEAISDVLVRCDFILGQDVGAFEKEFAEFSGAAHAIGCASGTDALHLALRALGVGEGDEVVMPAMTFVATALAISMTGATPVLVDVDPDTALMDPKKTELAISDRTKALMPVHLFGQCVDMDEFMKIADRHGLFVVEDAAQAHGATYKGRGAGTIGHAGAFSFYPGKNLGAFGDGGLVTTNDATTAERIKLLRNWGSLRKYHHEKVGLNSRLDTVQAAVLRVKLRRLAIWNNRRREIAEEYASALCDVPGVTLTAYNLGCVYHLYVIRTDERDATLVALNKSGIGAGIHYPFAVHELDAYADLGYAKGEFPVSEDWARRCISLPIYAELPECAVSRAVDILREIRG